MAIGQSEWRNTVVQMERVRLWEMMEQTALDSTLSRGPEWTEPSHTWELCSYNDEWGPCKEPVTQQG